MKFRFCGDADCPDWLLMQINTMSTLSLEQFEAMCEQVAISLEGGGDPDTHEWKDKSHPNYGILKGLGKEANLDASDLKACISGIAFILRSGTCYGVLSRELGAELEQLGLESRLASVVASIYSKHYEALRGAAKGSMLRQSTADDIKCVATEGDGLRLSMRIDGGERSVSLRMSRAQASSLLKDLNGVNDRLKSLCGD